MPWLLGVIWKDPSFLERVIPVTRLEWLNNENQALRQKVAHFNLFKDKKGNLAIQKLNACCFSLSWFRNQSERVSVSNGYWKLLPKSSKFLSISSCDFVPSQDWKNTLRNVNLGEYSITVTVQLKAIPLFNVPALLWRTEESSPELCVILFQ